MRKVLGFVLGAVLSVAAMAAVTITESQRVTLLRGGTSQATTLCPLGTCPSRAVCRAEAWRLSLASTATSGTVQYFCQNERDVITASYRPNPPPPVDCVVGEWSAWSGGSWLPAQCPAELVQTREETRTRSVLVQPANGGLACPALSETRTVSQACTPPPVDCVVSDPVTTTGTWSACQNGSRTRTDTLTRTVITQPAYGGAACPSLVTTTVVTEACVVSPPPSTAIFRDDFGYVVNRNDTADFKRAAFQAAGWGAIKDETTRPGGARGWISTENTIPGYTGAHPTPRFLKLEGRPSAGVGAAAPYQNQTDFYLSRGTPGVVGAANPSVPGNVWFQFYVHITPESRWAQRNKLIYPSDDGTQSGDGTQGTFLLHLRPSNQAGLVQPYGPNANAVAHVYGPSVASTAPEGGGRVGHNLTNAGFQLPGGWFQHKFHIDHSQEHGVYEHWIRPMGGNWLKTSEWRSGVTPGFTWITQANLRAGQNLFKIPTTWGTAASTDPTNYDVTLYIAQFVMASSESDLP